MKLINKTKNKVTVEVPLKDFIQMFRLLGTCSINEATKRLGEPVDTVVLYSKMYDVAVEMGLRRGIDY